MKIADGYRAREERNVNEPESLSAARHDHEERKMYSTTFEHDGTEYSVNDRHGYEDGRADATPKTPNLGDLNTANLRRQARPVGVVHDSNNTGTCTRAVCFDCFPTDGCTG